MGTATALFLDGLRTTLEQVPHWALAVGIVALAFALWLTLKLRLFPATTISLAVAGCLAAGLFTGLAVDAARHGALQQLETTSWPGALDDLAILDLPAFLVGILAGLQVLLLAFVAIACVMLWRHRWRETYITLAAGPLLFGVVAGLRSKLPRPPPEGTAPFPLASGFPDATAALAVSLAAVALWMFLRPGQPVWRRRLVVTGAFSAAALAASAPLLTGQAWPTDTLAGLALGAMWACAVLLGDVFAYRLLHPPLHGIARTSLVSRLQGLWGRLLLFCDRHLAGNGRLLVGLIAFGLLLRLPGIWTWALGPDAFRYAAMGHSLEAHGAFWMPWGDIYSPGTGPGPSHHFPPLYPAILAGFYKVGGFSETTTRAASMLLAFAAVAVTYACTRDLYGKGKALVAAAVIALDPILIMTTDKAYSENLLLITFVLALWAILRSLDRPWFIVLGALFAGLGYLTKSSLGAFFIVAGLGGLAWRLHWRGWKAIRDPAYVTGILVFMGIVAAWAYRNWSLFGDWQTSSHIQAAYGAALAQPGQWALLLVFSALVMVGLGYLLYMAVLPWLTHLVRIPKLADEHDSGLWLAFLLPIALTLPIDAALWLYERDFYLHNVRYVSFAIIPLIWLLVRNVRFTKATWAAVLVSFSILLVGSVYYTLPNRPLVNDVADRFGPLVQEGDSITFVDWNDVYRFYFDITADGTRDIWDVRYVTGQEAQGLTSTWAVVYGNGTWVDKDRYSQSFEMHKGREEWTVWRSDEAHAEPSMLQ